MLIRLAREFASAESFLAAFDGEMRTGSLTVPGAAPAGTTEFAECVVTLRIAREPPIDVPGWIGSILPRVSVGVLLAGGGEARSALASLAERLRSVPSAQAVEAADAAEAPEDHAAPDEPAEPDDAAPIPQTIFARLQAMGVTDKMRLALSGGRDERQALLRDLNKVLHPYVLRNPRIGLDEVQWAAKQSNLSPEALKVISEHPQWGADSTTCANLVRNPRTPTPIAVRLLDKLSMTDLRAIAKGGARQPIVTAARRKLGI